MITENCEICGDPAKYSENGFMCNRHYMQMKRHGKILSVERIMKRIPKNSHCNYCDSNKFLQWYKGILTCSKHRNHLVRHRKIIERTRFDRNEIIELESHCKMFLYDAKGNKVGYALFDKDDLNKIKKHRWSFDKDGYVVTRIKGKRVLLHRLILNYSGNDDVDHKNQVRYDNRKFNIRVATRSQNLQNRNSKGVSIDKRVKFKKFRAYITVDKRRIELGRFYTEEEAIKIRQEAVKRHFGEFACPEFREKF